MPAVFASQQKFNGGFRSDQLKVSFGGTDVAGFTVQSINASFTQQVSTVFELGSPNLYFVGGRAQGQASMSHLVGPTQLTGTLIRKYNNLCSPEDINLDASSGCRTGGSNYTLQDAVLVSLQVNTDVNQPVVSQTLGFMFANMDHQG